MLTRIVIYHLTRFFCEHTAGLLLRARCWGRHNVPRQGPAILAVNHQSFFDPILAGCFTTRVLSFMARDTLFESRAFAALIRLYNAYPVKRGSADLGAFKRSLRLLEQGGAIVLFPEATRTSDGRIRPVQPGVIGMARKARAMIVPVAVEGAFDVWPRGARFPRPAPVYVEYGTPIAPTAFADRSDVEASRMLTATMRAMHNRLRRRIGRHPVD